jgi:hypothetical protein
MKAEPDPPRGTPWSNQARVGLDRHDGVASVHVDTTPRAGDANVQNGTRHRWHNHGSGPAVLAVTVVGLPRAT